MHSKYWCKENKDTSQRRQNLISESDMTRTNLILPFFHGTLRQGLGPCRYCHHHLPHCCHHHHCHQTPVMQVADKESVLYTSRRNTWGRSKRGGNVIWLPHKTCQIITEITYLVHICTWFCVKNCFFQFIYILLHKEIMIMHKTFGWKTHVSLAVGVHVATVQCGVPFQSFIIFPRWVFLRGKKI